MTPEAARALDIARQHLTAADRSLQIQLAFVAAREAYLAGFHAATAYVLEKTGRPAKTHAGLRSEFARVARHELRIDPKFVGFLARAYTLKSAADYGADPSSAIPPAQAREVIGIAREFVEAIAVLLTSDGHA